MREPKTRLIAVEDHLGVVAEALRDRGYTVMSFREGRLDEAEAVVVSGQEDNVMGIQTRRTGAPVINAEGKTTAEIVRDLEARLGELGV